MLKASVVGVGFMGCLHARIYDELPGIDFVGIFDLMKEAMSDTAKKYNVIAFNDIDEMIKSSDIISVAVPTVLHYETAVKCLAKNKHLLIEKPLAATLSEAKKIVETAEEKNIIIAVGYIERFNSGVMELLKILRGKSIKEIEIYRMAPPANRANDVSVVFDLMIHDIDIACAITGSDPKEMTAKGEKINSAVLNNVTTEIVFDNGIKARIHASKVAEEKKRLIRVVCEDFVIEADLITKTIKQKDVKGESLISPAYIEPIKAEILDFVNAVEKGAKPRVSAADSLISLSIANEIEKKALVQ